MPIEIFAAAYTPETFGADLAAGATAILGWVGVAVTGGIGVMLALLGIRRGISTFRGVSK